MKPPQLRAALSRLAPDVRLYLIHGPDEAAAFDFAAQLGRTMGAGAERIDLDGATLRSDPARLADEAAAMSLFGDARWIRVTGVGEESLEAVTNLLAAARAGNPVLAIAPSLKATAKLVKLAGDSPAAIVTQCYAPTGRAAEQLVTDLALDHGLRPVRGAAQRIADAAGNDRAVIARELEKLALFLDADVGRVRELDGAALDAIGADLGEAAADEMIAALVDGRTAELGAELMRLAEAGAAPVQWLRQLARRLVLLIELRLEADRGNDPAMLVKRRVHFSEEDAVLRAVRRWNAARLARALDLVVAAERAEKSAATAGRVLSDQMAMTLGRAAADRR
ncbi:DNA polymerase III subunit delta [uncultured Sphingomonas sp.]|uniref:DNA polymerase III subunit delta n=1 Tax=uncultured Sphingomonas sp. TaxID=158754 RepID=UPI0035CBFD5C